jgi:methylated-DNA-[protein]-cysteine S-methyltransferase
MGKEIAVGSFESPIGLLWVACSGRGVCRVLFPGEGAQATLDRWLEASFPTSQPVAVSALLRQACTELGEYFTKNRRDFTLPLDLQGSPFNQRVWRELTSIPYGATVSYGQLARTLGSPKAARAVGAACGANPVPIIAPCHRVLGSDGSLHGFGGGLPLKTWLLQHEGVLLNL